MKDYGLSFISNEALFNHVKETITLNVNKKTSVTEIQNSADLHQNLLKKSIKNKNIFAKIKSKCPSMNSMSGRDTYIEMQNEILKDRSTICYLVELLAKSHRNTTWEITIDGQKLSHENLRRIAISDFYSQVTGIKSSFKNLCQILPQVIDDVLNLTHYPIANLAVSCHK